MTKAIKLSTTPSVQAVEDAIKAWQQREVSSAQSAALDKLFSTFKSNQILDNVLLKVAALNDFYSTNLRGSYYMARHICKLGIDERLRAGDLSLVGLVAKATFPRGEVNCYSFASKYCAYHEPTKFAIYDSYVRKILMFFKARDEFASFKEADLKDYVSFIAIIKDFQRFYGLEKFNLKQIDQYLWQLGKQEFARLSEI